MPLYHFCVRLLSISCHVKSFIPYSLSCLLSFLSFLKGRVTSLSYLLLEIPCSQCSGICFKLTPLVCFSVSGERSQSSVNRGIGRAVRQTICQVAKSCVYPYVYSFIHLWKFCSCICSLVVGFALFGQRPKRVKAMQNTRVNFETSICMLISLEDSQALILLS